MNDPKKKKGGIFTIDEDDDEDNGTVNFQKDIKKGVGPFA